MVGGYPEAGGLGRTYHVGSARELGGSGTYQWAFFRNEAEITWDEVQDQMGIVEAYRRIFHAERKGHWVPWGDEIEALVALEDL